MIRARDLQFCYRIWLIFNESICGTKNTSVPRAADRRLVIHLSAEHNEFFRLVSAALAWYCVGLQLKWIISAYCESSFVEGAEEILCRSLPMLRKTWKLPIDVRKDHHVPQASPRVSLALYILSVLLGLPLTVRGLQGQFLWGTTRKFLCGWESQC